VIAFNPDVVTAIFLVWITVQPRTCGGLDVTNTVIEQVGFIILTFGREPHQIRLCHRPCGADDLTKGPVLIISGAQSHPRHMYHIFVGMRLIIAEDHLFPS